MYVCTYHVVENWWEKASANLTIRLFGRENIVNTYKLNMDIVYVAVS